MALVVADRVQETTSTTGTSDYALLGAETGYQSFGSVMANSDTTYYAVVNDTDWEVGVGTYSTTGPTLARTTILESSNSDAAVDWGVGVKKIFLTYAADRSVYLNANGDLAVDGTTLFVDATNDRVGVGTATPANRLDVIGDVPLACSFVSTTTGTTMDVTSVTSGTLAVGQTVTDQSGYITAKIAALGTGTGGVGTYTLDRDVTTTTTGLSNPVFRNAYLPEPITLRVGNSASSYQRGRTNGILEFYGANPTAGARARIRSVNSSPNSGQPSTLVFDIGNGGSASATLTPTAAMVLSPASATLPGSMSLGNHGLLPANFNYGYSNLNFGGRSLATFAASNLSTMQFSGFYIDAGVQYGGSYGQIGYVVDSSFTVGQLPSNFFVHTRNAAGTTAERFRIDKDGNVGIGTTTPATKLDVNGTANATTLSIGGTAITATAAELNYVDGVTSSIQAQLDALVGQSLMLMGG